MLTKIVLIGGTKRAVSTLKAILEADIDSLKISLCIFMPGYADELVYARQLEQIAKDNRLPYLSTNTITRNVIEQLKTINPTLMFVIGVWRSIISNEILNIPEFGCIGLHGTPLPRLRGFAGVYWQIINGYDQIKTRFYRLDQGIDSGPYACDEFGNLLEYAISIDNEKHLNEILRDYEIMHVSANVNFLKRVVNRKFTFKPQPESKATYACHRGPDDGEIDWSITTKGVFNFIRAQSKPCPGAFTYFDNKKVIIWRAKPLYDYINYEGRIPGKVVSRSRENSSVIILTLDGAIEVLQVEVNGEVDMLPYNIFNSIRKKCQTSLEAKVNILMERIEKMFGVDGLVNN